jgi:hypothetical protein
MGSCLRGLVLVLQDEKVLGVSGAEQCTAVRMSLMPPHTYKQRGKFYFMHILQLKGVIHSKDI